MFSWKVLWSTVLILTSMSGFGSPSIIAWNAALGTSSE